mmetsp:Transcript_85969/g.149764  ORF Transcript_85969/g.149764 Transcript_85969/m.149764 type:complete len:329 (-) Transcript_85969:6-992(-)
MLDHSQNHLLPVAIHDQRLHCFNAILHGLKRFHEEFTPTLREEAEAFHCGPCPPQVFVRYLRQGWFACTVVNLSRVPQPTTTMSHVTIIVPIIAIETCKSSSIYHYTAFCTKRLQTSLILADFIHPRTTTPIHEGKPVVLHVVRAQGNLAKLFTALRELGKQRRRHAVQRKLAGIRMPKIKRNNHRLFILLDVISITDKNFNTRSEKIIAIDVLIANLCHNATSLVRLRREPHLSTRRKGNFKHVVRKVEGSRFLHGFNVICFIHIFQFAPQVIGAAAAGPTAQGAGNATALPSMFAEARGTQVSHREDNLRCKCKKSTSTEQIAKDA